MAFVLIGLGAKAQSSLIKTSPGGLAFGFFNACYEKVINDKSSFQLSAGFFFSGLETANGESLSAFNVGAGYRFYVTAQEAPRGFYVMPFASFSSGSGDTNIAIGADLGYQWVWDSGFALDIGLGPAYNIADDTSAFSNGITPSIVTAVGLAF